MKLSLLLFFLTGAVALLAPRSAAAIDPPPAPGSFDASFGTAGSGRVHDIAITLNGPDYLTAIRVQPDRRIVLAGGCGTPLKFCIARLNGDGTLDTSFIGDNVEPGKFTLNIGVPGLDAVVTAMAVQPDGKLLLAGWCRSAAGTADACLARLLPDGRFDASFVGPGGGGAGRFTLPISNRDDAIASILLQADGRIVLIGSCRLGDLNASCGARLHANGALDTSFVGPAGNGAGLFVASLSGGQDFVIQARLQPDHKILIASHCSNDPQARGVERGCVTRLDATGRFDASFNPAGTPGQIRFISAGAIKFAPAALALQADGKPVLAGSCEAVAAQPRRLCIIRYLPDGIADRSFVGPTREGRGSFVIMPSGAASVIRVHGMETQSDGKLVVTAKCRPTDAEQGSELCVARLHDDGSFDRSFDGPDAQAPGNGSFLQRLGPANVDSPQLALQSDGQIVYGYYCATAGLAPARLCVARVHGGSYAAPRCTLDVDGDGNPASVADVLIAARATTGFTRQRVYAGIDFAASATRIGWDALHRYLSRDCGLPLGANTAR